MSINILLKFKNTDLIMYHYAVSIGKLIWLPAFKELVLIPLSEKA